MSREEVEKLLMASVVEGGLSSTQVAQILTFRLFGNRDGYVLLPGLPIGAIPPTPASRESMYKDNQQSERLLLQATALLGDPIGYTQESCGSLVNNFFPHRSRAKAASSDSFDTELDLHTENAFHPVQPDFLALLCLRQDPLAEAVTYISSVNRVVDHLTEEEIEFLREEPYNFLSDYSSTDKNRREDLGRWLPVLYGDPERPFFRFDPQFMVARNNEAQRLLERLREIAWEVVRPVRLRAGDLLIIDNRKTAHARSPFTARFDGSDRWIQRTFAVCNQRHYVERLGSSSRVYGLMRAL